MIRFNATTPVKFYAKVTSYVQGEGTTTTWEEIESDGYTSFYCEWRGTFGDRAIAAQAQGVKESATIRMFYNPPVYNKLRMTHVLVIKNADTTAFIDGEPDKKNTNLFELWGGVDNVMEENQYLEFKVRRYEGK